MHFEQLLAMAAELGKDKTKVMQFPENWCQGRTAFGGLSAALLYQAIRQHIDNSRRLLSLSTNFVGPLIADNDFSIDVEVLREGKNSAQVLYSTGLYTTRLDSTLLSTTLRWASAHAAAVLCRSLPRHKLRQSTGQGTLEFDFSGKAS